MHHILGIKIRRKYTGFGCFPYFFRNVVDFFPFHAADDLFQFIPFFQKGFCCLGNFSSWYGKHFGNSRCVFCFFVIIRQCTHTADDFQSGAAFVILGGKNLHHANFSGFLHMGAAACTAVIFPNCHDAHFPFQCLFAAVFQLFQFFFGRISNLRSHIPPDGFVGSSLQHRQVFRRNFCVKVNQNGIFAHVETHVVTAVFAANDTGKDMFAGMVLHQVKTMVPVNMTFHFRAHFQRLIGDMRNDAVFFPNVCHLCAAQRADIRRLSATFGVKVSAFQYHSKVFALRLAGYNLAHKIHGISIVII